MHNIHLHCILDMKNNQSKHNSSNIYMYMLRQLVKQEFSHLPKDLARGRTVKLSIHYITARL